MALALVAFVLASTACIQERFDFTEREVGKDCGDTESLFDDVDVEVADQEAQARLGAGASSASCATVTWEQAWGIFPNTMTIDFGTGCTGRHGWERSGKIVVNYTDDMMNEGATRTLTFEDFFVGSTQVTGTRVVENLGADEDGFMTFRQTVSIGRVNNDRDTEMSWEASRVATLIEGGDTPDDYSDDVLSIVGSANGTTHRGYTFSSNILTPLIKQRACQWIVSGVVEVTTDERVRTLDYGEGECDEEATVSSNGETRTIRLRRHR